MGKKDSDFNGQNDDFWKNRNQVIVERLVKSIFERIIPITNQLYFKNFNILIFFEWKISLHMNFSFNLFLEKKFTI